MDKVTKNEKQFWMDKLLILLAIICVTLALSIIGMYLDNAEIFIFAKSANQMKENYTTTSTER